MPPGASHVAADPVRGAVGAEDGGRAFRSERRLVTALFADISGFSELMGRLDAEELQCRRPLRRRRREVRRRRDPRATV